MLLEIIQNNIIKVCIANFVNMAINVFNRETKVKHQIITKYEKPNENPNDFIKRILR